MNSLKNKINQIPITVRASSAYAICSIIQRCISFITMPIFIRMLTQEQYGEVTVYASWQGILSTILTLNLAYGSFSAAMVKFESERDKYISSIEGICIVLSISFLIVYLPFRNLWNELFGLPTYLICFMVMEILASTSVLLWSGKKRFEFKYISVIVVTLLSTLLSITLQFVLVTNTSNKGHSMIVAASIVTITSGMIIFFINIFKGKRIIDKEFWKYAFGFNIPLLAYYLSQNIFNQSDRIMIDHIVGTDKAAVYGSAYSLGMVLSFVLNAINNSYVPWYYGKIKAGQMHENKSVSLGISALMAILLLGVIWFAPEIVLIMAGPKYSEAIYVVPPVAISLLLLFYSQLFINVEFYYEEKKKLVLASIGSALINFVLNFVFIRIFGFIAAAYTTLISYIVFALANYIAMKKVLKENNVEDNAYNYKLLVSLFIVFVILAYLGVAMYNFLIPRIVVCIIVLIVLFLKRKLFIDLIKRIKNK